MCRVCCDQVQLLNRVAHQKYRMYVECAKRVADKRSHDPHKDTTIILNELLADESWLSQVKFFTFDEKLIFRKFASIIWKYFG